MRKVAVLAGLMVALATLPVRAATVPLVTGPQDVSQLNATLNGIINNINAILMPLTGPNNSAATGGVTILPGTATYAPSITTYSTSGATSVNLKIAPLGNGKIVLFNSNITPNSTGILKIANSPSWVRTQGLAACPGGLKALPTPNGSTSGTITGYWLVQDWAERIHAVPTC